MLLSYRSSLLALGTAALLAACVRDETEATSDSATGTAAAAEFERAATISGEFKTPESVVFDEAGDVFFVSNINGSPGDKDNNGFISRVRGEGGEVDSLMFIAGGRSGVTLNAPKGLAITGDTLWVTDIDAVRAFDKNTGRPFASHTVQGAVFLNDIAAGPDGALYITDTGIRFTDSGMSHPGPDRIFKLTRDGQVSTALEFRPQIAPNGIAWDEEGQRFIVGSFAGNDIVEWKPGATKPTRIASGKGQFDGVERLADGRILVSSWTDSSIYMLDGSALVRVVSGVESPADIGIDTKRNRVAIPLFQANRIELWTIPNRTGI
ncbi:MAG: SMP-30/gluconolactonase/LRE family protein [Gemmatimonadaceae bacterium]